LDERLKLLCFRCYGWHWTEGLWVCFASRVWKWRLTGFT